MSTNGLSNKFVEVCHRGSGDDQTCRPCGRSGHSMVSDEANIYVFGGYNPQGGYQTKTPCVLVELWKFNYATHKWKNVTSPGTPDTCASSCMVMHGRKLVIYGGTGYPFGVMISNSIKLLDFKSRTSSGMGGSWYLLETNPNVYNCLDQGDNMPPRAYGQSLICHNDCFYTFGGAVGFYDEAVNDLHCLNRSTMAWEKLFPNGEPPTGRYKQEVAVYGDRFFVFGGGRLSYTEDLKSIFAYKFRDNRWECIRAVRDSQHGFPRPRCSFGLIQVETNVYICGGRFYSDEITHEGLSDVWKISLKTFEWQKLSVSLPEKLYFHRAVVSPSHYLHIFGGVTEQGIRSWHLHKWRIPLHVAKLQELCWEVVTDKFRGLDTVPKDKLEFTYGIPRQFVDRIQ